LSDIALKKLSRKALIKSKIKSIKKKASELLLFSLESRLDSTLYRSYFVSSLASARQLITHGSVLVNNKKVTKNNFLLKQGDLIRISENAERRVKTNILNAIFWPLPPVHLEINFKILTIYFVEDIKFIHLSNSYSFWLNLKSVFSFYKN
jgi:small subunit ribosomal protein S4